MLFIKFILSACGVFVICILWVLSFDKPIEKSTNPVKQLKLCSPKKSNLNRRLTGRSESIDTISKAGIQTVL